MTFVKKIGEAFGKDVFSITLSNDTDFSFEVLSLGATIRSIIMNDKNGKPIDLCLGYDTVDEYLTKSGYLGACIGRYANRIENAEIVVNDVTYKLVKNEGENQLHGGIDTFDKKIWDFTTDENSVTFTLLSPDMEEGFPGNLQVSTKYTIEDRNLIIEYTATTDKDTVINLTNHAYFNLSGHNFGPTDNHYLSMKSSFYTPVKAGAIPTGEILSVENTMFDIRKTIKLGDVVFGEQGSFDHNFILDRLTYNDVAATLYSDDSGIKMETYTTKPAIQVYCAGSLGEVDGKGNSHYSSLGAICLETQFYPNSTKFAHFPSPFLKVGETYNHKTKYAFSIDTL